MRTIAFTLITLIGLVFTQCQNDNLHANTPLILSAQLHTETTSSKFFKKDSWQYFLQHLPTTDSPIVDYKGNAINYQEKHVAIVQYDVGAADLQQCADALMRLRAEYLFSQNKADEIGFHFTGGGYYKYTDYCNGLRPVPKGNSVVFVQKTAGTKTHETLRKYLDIVYAYASTISLEKELQTANDFEVGAVIIHAGSPGHCFIIIDEAMDDKGERLLSWQKVTRLRNLYMCCAIFGRPV